MKRSVKIPRSAVQSGRNFYDAISLISDRNHDDDTLEEDRLARELQNRLICK